MSPARLRLHATLDGYALAFIGADRYERIASFSSLAAASLALREAEAAARRVIALLPRAEGTTPRPHLF